MEGVVSEQEYGTGSIGGAPRDGSMSQTATDEQQQQQQQSEDDLVHEVLAMNTLAMQRCNAEMLEDAGTILSEAYMKLHNYNTNGDQRLVDTLRSTTLNNLGVVECHRGQHRQALSHFEAARQLEEAWGAASPSVALNTCAAYNALGMYDKATAAATETIDMLRTLALQEKNGDVPAATITNDGNGTTFQGSGIAIAKSDNKALWGAAWHNMAVAQINTAKGTRDPTEHSNVVVLFQNAMRATQELLGRDHSMTKCVTETYRAVRDALRTHGVYKQHHRMLTAPPRPVDPRDEEDDMERYLQQSGGKSRRRAKEKYYRDLTITFFGEATNGVKLTERLDPTPYPGAKDVVFRQKKGKKMPPVLRGMALSGTLLKAGQLYGNPHPLLYSLPPNYHSTTNTAPTLKDGFNTATDSCAEMTPNTPADAVSGRTPPKRRPGKPSQKSASASYQQSSYKEQKNQSHHEQHPKSQRQDNPNYQHSPSKYTQTQSQYQQAPPNYQEAKPNYPQAPPGYQQSPSGQRKAPSSYQQTPAKYNHTSSKYQESSSNYPPTDPESFGDVSSRHPVPQEGSTTSKTTYPASTQRAPRPPSAQRPGSGRRLLPPLKKTSTRGDGGVGGTVVAPVPGREAGSAGSGRQAPQLTSRVSVPTAGPIYEQIKYILLAEPQENRPQRGETGRGSSPGPTRPISASSNNTLQTAECELLTDVDAGKAHPLFNAMWVSTKPSLDANTVRTVGRPSYYVTSVVDLTKEQVALPEEVLQMMVESSSSSMDDTPPLNL
ncbi:hypothetical protein DQ04_03831040 [Trypanosoma grayi]|uniref:hypothetical protein n=1 Tax=Trypanosoma grayi TaxID=71804 RepID=UPI0004F44580|nr:hypothetical protein DQ04_03831040 [Trypanosoma grayi]KEG10354.1 hypothetical protein DQ04_03831040 [Trypanosoma grayi]